MGIPSPSTQAPPEAAPRTARDAGVAEDPEADSPGAARPPRAAGPGDETAGGVAEVRPNLLIIGAQKCGTTWLFKWLKAHPDIAMAQGKEINVLQQAGASLASFAPFFPDGPGRRYSGEASTSYLWTQTAESMAGTRRKRPDIAGAALRVLGPDIRLVVALRHPVERAISAYMHHFRRGRITPETRLRDVAHRFAIIEMGQYRSQVLAWQAVFAASQFHVVFHDDIAARPKAVMRRLYAWLGLEPLRLAGSDKPENRGLGLRLEDGRAVLDAEDRMAQRFASRAGGAVMQQMAIEQADVDALLPVYRDDIAFAMNELGGARHRWGERQRLEEFVRGRPRQGAGAEAD